MEELQESKRNTGALIVLDEDIHFDVELSNEN